MKLYAVVDKDGDIIRIFTFRDDAYEYAVINVDFIKELHTYDPASQVVVDKRMVLSMFFPAQEEYGWSCTVGDAIEFLSAGKELQPKCSCIPYEYGSGNEVPDNSKCPVHGKEST